MAGASITTGKPGSTQLASTSSSDRSNTVLPRSETPEVKMATRAGPQAKDALLTLLGDHQIQLDTLIHLLIAKGFIAEDEWDRAMTVEYQIGADPSEQARRCLNAEDTTALDTFFRD
jgi:hypothetical protein